MVGGGILHEGMQGGAEQMQHRIMNEHMGATTGRCESHGAVPGGMQIHHGGRGMPMPVQPDQMYLYPGLAIPQDIAGNRMIKDMHGQSIETKEEKRRRQLSEAAQRYRDKKKREKRPLNPEEEDAEYRRRDTSLNAGETKEEKRRRQLNEAAKRYRKKKYMEIARQNALAQGQIMPVLLKGESVVVPGGGVPVVASEASQVHAPAVPATAECVQQQSDSGVGVAVSMSGAPLSAASEVGVQVSSQEEGSGVVHGTATEIHEQGKERDESQGEQEGLGQEG